MGASEIKKELEAINSELDTIFARLTSGDAKDALDIIATKLGRISEIENRVTELIRAGGEEAKIAAQTLNRLQDEHLRKDDIIKREIRRTNEESRFALKQEKARNIYKKEALKYAQQEQKAGRSTPETRKIIGDEARDRATHLTEFLKDVYSMTSGDTKAAGKQLGGLAQKGGKKTFELFTKALLGTSSTLSTVLLPILAGFSVAALAASKNLKLLESRLKYSAAGLRAMDLANMKEVGEQYHKWMAEASYQHMVEAEAIEAIMPLTRKYNFNLVDFLKSTDDLGFSLGSVRRLSAGLGMSEQQVTGILDSLVNTYRTQLTTAKAQTQATKAMNMLSAYALRVDRESIMDRSQFMEQTAEAVRSTNQYHVSASGLATLMDSFARITGRSRVAQDQLASMTTQAVQGMRGMNDAMAILAMPDKGLAALWEWPTLDPDEMQRRVQGMFGGMLRITDEMSGAEKGLRLLTSSGITGLNRDVARRIFMAPDGRAVSATDQQAAITETREATEITKDMYHSVAKFFKWAQMMGAKYDTALSNLVQRTPNF